MHLTAKLPVSKSAEILFIPVITKNFFARLFPRKQSLTSHTLLFCAEACVFSSFSLTETSGSVHHLQACFLLLLHGPNLLRLLQNSRGSNCVPSMLDKSITMTQPNADICLRKHTCWFVQNGI